MRPLRYASDELGGRPYLADAVLNDSELARLHERRLASGADQRRAPRQRVMLSALIAHSDFNFSFRCALHDISDGGVRLKAPPGALVPNRFLLIHISGARGFEAEVAWRRYPHIGATLGPVMDLREPSSQLARRLRVLWLGAIS